MRARGERPTLWRNRSPAAFRPSYVRFPSVSLITSQADFDHFCERIRAAGIVAFDTEFVSESYYRPRLCLLQFAIPDAAVCVDPFAVPDLSAWWNLMVDDRTTVIVHGGREEIRFCQFANVGRPRQVVDVQVAEGLLSRGFPISHSNLISRVLGRTINHGQETRTDWQQRPLSERQIKYAIEDVQHLIDVWGKQSQSLQQAGRLNWARAEFESFIDGVLAEEEREGWTRLPGYPRLSRRDMGVARELFRWRQQVAEQVNKPQRRILRDDLLVDLAKRQPKTVRDMNLTRDMNRRDYQQYADDIVAAIQRACDIPKDELPQKHNGPQHPAQDEVLAKILGLALANRCQELGLSMTLVATGADLKEFISWHVFGHREDQKPRLMEGWRAEVCGQLLADVLDGKVTLRVADPQSEYPLAFSRE